MSFRIADVRSDDLVAAQSTRPYCRVAWSNLSGERRSSFPTGDLTRLIFSRRATARWPGNRPPDLLDWSERRTSPSAAFTSPLACDMSSCPAWRSFSSAITRPMSLRLCAPVSATIAAIAASASASLICARQEGLDHRDFGRFGVGQLRAAALGVHVDRFAALLDHLLQHLGDQGIVVGRVGGAVRSSMSRFLIAAWIRRIVSRRALSPPSSRR